MVKAHGIFAAAALLLCATVGEARTLRVCADPNNLPFSDQAQQGFENKIVAVLARHMGAEVAYTWWAQRRGFIRHTLKAGLCDVVPGVPTSLDMLRTTAPYYRSTYVAVTRRNAPVIHSLDDPLLRSAKIGVQLIGDDGANSPPAMGLARRGIIRNVRGYTVYGDYGRASPPAAIVQAVANKDVDVAFVWGPLAGYFAPLQRVPLRLTPVPPFDTKTMLPMTFDISMGVRREDEALRDEINAAIDAERTGIDAILTAYRVPRTDQRLAGSRP